MLKHRVPGSSMATGPIRLAGESRPVMVITTGQPSVAPSVRAAPRGTSIRSEVGTCEMGADVDAILLPRAASSTACTPFRLGLAITALSGNCSASNTNASRTCATSEASCMDLPPSDQKDAAQSTDEFGGRPKFSLQICSSWVLAKSESESNWESGHFPTSSVSSSLDPSLARPTARGTSSRQRCSPIKPSKAEGICKPLGMTFASSLNSAAKFNRCFLPVRPFGIVVMWTKTCGQSCLNVP
mmetsp:Transcript_58616/g.116261  ORF Transcript_58616/g.116261 Transcript_58616/m.116261 type:complete len:242 (-) Transcript_58616:1126-1851(-)